MVFGEIVSFSLKIVNELVAGICGALWGMNFRVVRTVSDFLPIFVVGRRGWTYCRKKSRKGIKDCPVITLSSLPNQPDRAVFLYASELVSPLSGKPLIGGRDAVEGALWTAGMRRGRQSVRESRRVGAGPVFPEPVTTCRRGPARFDGRGGATRGEGESWSR